MAEGWTIAGCIMCGGGHIFIMGWLSDMADMLWLLGVRFIGPSTTPMRPNSELG